MKKFSDFNNSVKKIVSWQLNEEHQHTTTYFSINHPSIFKANYLSYLIGLEAQCSQLKSESFSDFCVNDLLKSCISGLIYTVSQICGSSSNNLVLENIHLKLVATKLLSYLKKPLQKLSMDIKRNVSALGNNTIRRSVFIKKQIKKAKKSNDIDYILKLILSVLGSVYT